MSLAIAVTSSDFEGKRYITFCPTDELRVSDNSQAHERYAAHDYEDIWNFVRLITTAEDFGPEYEPLRQDFRNAVGENVYLKLSIENERHEELGSMSFVPNPLKAK